MGFLDKARAAATDLAAKADSALSSAGSTAPQPADADRYFRDLGLLTYLEATGRPVDPADRERVMGGLRDLDAAGGIRSFMLHTSPPPAPGGQTPPPAPGGQTPPPPRSGQAPSGPPASGSATPPPAAPRPESAPPAAAPPPPSWASGNGEPKSP